MPTADYHYSTVRSPSIFKATPNHVCQEGKVEEELELKGSVNKSFCVIQVDGKTTQR